MDHKQRLSSLVNDMIAGSTAAENEFFREVFNISYVHGLHLYRDDESAKDTAQDVSLDMFKKYIANEKINAMDNVPALVLTMTRNRFINDYRRNATKKNGFVNFSSADEHMHPMTGACDEELVLDDLYEQVCPVDEKTRLWQLNQDGYKYKELAEMFDMNIGTVKSQIFFAREKMQENYHREQRRLGRRA